VERRELLGLTQTELAEKTGIDQGDISRIERGSIYPNEKTLLRLADALGAQWRMVDKASA
jgi:transcriptional regulator with XRE-family HTH domain